MHVPQLAHEQLRGWQSQNGPAREEHEGTTSRPVLSSSSDFAFSLSVMWGANGSPIRPKRRPQAAASRSGAAGPRPSDAAASFGSTKVARNHFAAGIQSAPIPQTSHGTLEQTVLVAWDPRLSSVDASSARASRAVTARIRLLNLVGSVPVRALRAVMMAGGSEHAAMYAHHARARAARDVLTF
eukprot:SAG31_NODE_220_length_19925_cov_3.630939_10_plen_184_part_00